MTIDVLAKLRELEANSDLFEDHQEEFILSLVEQIEDGKDLSKNQVEWVKKYYDMLMEKMDY